MLGPRRSVALLLAVALLLLGGWFAGQQYVAATTYERTAGTVQSAEMETSQRVGGGIRLGGDQYYRPNVTYSYRVEGRSYTGRNVALGGEVDTNARGRAAEVLNRYSTGEEITVHYDPDAPERAYLSRRFAFFPGGVLFAAGLLLLGDALTPRTRVIGFVLARIPLGPEGRRSDGEERRHAVPDDPTAILDGRGSPTSLSVSPEPVDAAPLTGRAAQAAWLAVGLGILATVVGFVAVSRPPYDETAIFTGVGAVLAFGRGAYQSLLG
ncbi:DUF3592 domain-containing protein [Halomicroarcula limicola]|uniref:DUF3592 domain-containing protein n=1 Tax=Haloarcula limicola TaxID=1429915 RepID=A0A8J8C3J5_9EURY|nr:DUF3592 domain-containing protein [Halomicroarcula limicola]MBV0924387.1 DUF3592 domain-containing protein [Halomicroarcula limicola]